MPIDADIEFTRLGPMHWLSDGGQGTVFRLPERPGCVLKLYHEGISVHGNELRRLIDLLPGLGANDRVLLESATAWPTHRVVSSGRCIGLLMNEAPCRFGALLAGRNHLRELQYLLYRRRAMWRELALPDSAQRIQLAHAYLRVFAVLHGNHMVAGDVSMKNLLWTLEPRPGVFFLDCDGIRSGGRRPAIESLDTVDWADPAAPSAATLDSDRYKIALLVLRLVLASPSVTPELLAERVDRRAELSAGLAELVERAAEPGARPTVQAWQAALRAVRQDTGAPDG